MIATDQQIEDLNYETSLEPMFDSDETVMDSESFAEYQQEIQKAKQEATEKITKNLIDRERKIEKFNQSNISEQIRKRVEKQYSQNPTYIAFYALAGWDLPNGNKPKNSDKITKLSAESIINAFDKKTTLNKLSRRIYTKEAGGMDINTAAYYLGFESGIELVQSLMDFKTPKQNIENELQLYFDAKNHIEKSISE